MELLSQMKYLGFIVLMTSMFSVNAKISRIYHPYVVSQEKEFEYRTLRQETDLVTDIELLQILGYGQSINDELFLEFYIVSERVENGSAAISAYEGEALLQLTEQGEYWADWGLVFEVEKVVGLSKWDMKSGVLIEKEWGKWSSTANLFLIYEYGDDYIDEWHTAGALQWRYRYSQSFEPSLEFYSSEFGASIGPAISGQLKMDNRKINWEIGYQFGIDDKAPDTYWRTLIEFEF